MKLKLKNEDVERYGANPFSETEIKKYGLNPESKETRARYRAIDDLKIYVEQYFVGLRGKLSQLDLKEYIEKRKFMNDSGDINEIIDPCIKAVLEKIKQGTSIQRPMDFFLFACLMDKSNMQSNNNLIDVLILRLINNRFHVVKAKDGNTESSRSLVERGFVSDKFRQGTAGSP